MAKTGKLKKQVVNFKAFQKRIGARIFRPEAAIVMGCIILLKNV